MSYEEYISWRTFYALEPWGWHDREYRTASIMTLLLNLRVDRSHQKKMSYFYRNMFEAIDNETHSMRVRYLNATPGQRVKMIADSLGATVKRKRE